MAIIADFTRFYFRFCRLVCGGGVLTTLVAAVYYAVDCRPVATAGWVLAAAAFVLADVAFARRQMISVRARPTRVREPVQ